MTKTVAIKIGSGVILTDRNKPDEFRIAHIRDQIVSLRNKNISPLLIVSGAVGCGMNFVESEDENSKKAAAGIGQAHLVSVFIKYFSAKNLNLAQLLFTKDLFLSEAGRQSAKNILEYYITQGIIPFINENDAIELNSFGGNDCLAKEIASLIGANQVIILSQMSESIHGVGGGKTKLRIVEELNQKGIRTSILNGKERNIIENNIV